MSDSIRIRAYGYPELTGDLARLRHNLPGTIRAETIGTSVMGREIPALWLGCGPRLVHLNGAVHANEWITSLLLMTFAGECASAIRSCEGVSRGESAGFAGSGLCRLLADVSLAIVPMVNPDGVELALQRMDGCDPHFAQLLQWNGGSADFSGWKANIRGVDLNDQFPAHWEEERQRRASAGPGPRDYSGPAPLSEPEAAALAAFTCRHAFQAAIAFHTQGEEIYWNYRDLEPREACPLADRMAAASGYAAVKLTDSDAGYKDWFIQEFRRPGFTVEAGRGVNPLPLEQFAGIYGKIRPLILEAIRYVSSEG